MKKKNEKIVKIGGFGVDSGQVIIMDPCYIDGHWKKDGKTGMYGGGTYEDCCNLILSKKKYGELKYASGHKGLGVVSTTGFGDGYYPVYATIKNYPYFTKGNKKHDDWRTSRITIEFIPDD